MSEPPKNPNWELHKTHSQIRQSSTANATWAQTTQYRPANEKHIVSHSWTPEFDNNTGTTILVKYRNMNKLNLITMFGYRFA